MSGKQGPERVPTSAIRAGSTLADERTQTADAIHNLRNGHDARLSLPGFAVTAVVRELDSLSQHAMFVVWFRDHVTGELAFGEPHITSPEHADAAVPWVVQCAWSLLRERHDRHV